MAKRGGASNPIRRGGDWFRENSNIQARGKSALLLGISPATVGRYWGEMPDNDGGIASPKAKGPPGKGRVKPQYEDTGRHGARYTML